MRTPPAVALDGPSAPPSAIVLGLPIKPWTAAEGPARAQSTRAHSLRANLFPGSPTLPIGLWE